MIEPAMPIYDNSPHFGLQISAWPHSVTNGLNSTSGKNSLTLPDFH
jgi:hypothetical protein